MTTGNGHYPGESPGALRGRSNMAQPDAVLHMRGVTRAYVNGPELLEVLRGVDLEVHAGEWVSIVGVSGSGKSTLLNLIGLLDQPDGGTYLLNGTDVTMLDDRARSRARNRELGFVFQRANLLPRTSALENVCTPLIYAGIGRLAQRQRAAWALAQVGLEDRMNHDASQLSGGQMQRVAIARALVTDPAVLLADEPTGNLDPASSAEVLELMAQLHRSGRTVIMITHDLAVADLADRQLELVDGMLHPVARTTART